MDKKLSVTQTAGESFRFLGQHFLPLLALLLQFSLLGFAGAIISVLIFGAEPSPAQRLVPTFIVFFAWPALAIPIHRSILVGEAITPQRFFFNLFSSRARRFISYMLIFVLIGTVVAMTTIAILFAVVGSDAGENQVNPLLTLVPLVVVYATFAYFFRFLFIFPAIASDEFESLAACRNLIRGSMWRTFWSMVLAAVPIQVAVHFGAAAILANDSVALATVDAAVGGIAAMLVVAVISLSYSHARQRAAAN